MSIATIGEVRTMTKTIEEIHAEAEKLTLQWWPDTAKYPKEKRMSELSIMKMLVDLEDMNARIIATEKLHNINLKLSE